MVVVIGGKGGEKKKIKVIRGVRSTERRRKRVEKRRLVSFWCCLRGETQGGSREGKKRGKKVRGGG